MESRFTSGSNAVTSIVIIDMGDERNDLNVFSHDDFDKQLICNTTPPIKVCLDTDIPSNAFEPYYSKKEIYSKEECFIDDHYLKKSSTELRCPFDQCKKIFKDRFKLQNHYRSHQEKKHKCQYCQHKFTYLKDKKIHERIHTGERPYQCHQCKRSFAQKITLSNHLLTHSNNEKSEICDICGRAYYHKKSLAHHKKEKHFQHLGECLFTCSKCGKKYLELTRYKIHTAKCKGKKVFSCQACNLDFKSEKQLQEHKMQCTQSCIFQCGICDEIMNSENELRHHLLDRHKTGFDECVKIQMLEEQDVTKLVSDSSDQNQFAAELSINRVFDINDEKL